MINGNIGIGCFHIFTFSSSLFPVPSFCAIVMG